MRTNIQTMISFNYEDSGFELKYHKIVRHSIISRYLKALNK